MKTQSHRALVSATLAALAIATSPRVFAELPQLTPTQRVEPTASEVAADDDDAISFGSVVAMDGNWAMVSMPEYNSGDAFGGIALYHRELSGHWARVGRLQAPAGAFGLAITLVGDTALIPSASGSPVYVYRLKHGVWTLTSQLAPPAGRPINYGHSIRYDNGTVTVAATYTDDFTRTIFLYRLDNAGQVASGTQLFASDAEPGTVFGTILDLQDDTLVVSGATSTQNAVLVFRRFGNQWVQTQTIADPSTDTPSAFGASLALNHGVLLVGNPYARSFAGEVYAYVLTNGRFTYRTQLHPTPDQLADYSQFGSRIVMDGDRAVISAFEPPSFLYANGVAVVYERQGNEAVATHIARFDDGYAMAISGNRLLLGSPYFVDYDDNSFHQIGWADFYTLPPIGGDAAQLR